MGNLSNQESFNPVLFPTNFLVQVFFLLFFSVLFLRFIMVKTSLRPTTQYVAAAAGKRCPHVYGQFSELVVMPLMNHKLP